MGDEPGTEPELTPRRPRFLGIPEAAASYLAPACLGLLGILMIGTVLFGQPAMFAVSGVLLLGSGVLGYFALARRGRAELPTGIGSVVLLVVALVLFARSAG